MADAPSRGTLTTDVREIWPDIGVLSPAPVPSGPSLLEHRRRLRVRKVARLEQGAFVWG
jgi:hypothetical protein